MLSKGPLSILLLLSASVVPRVFSVAIPAAHSTEDNSYVELDPAKEYSESDLTALWEQHAAHPDVAYKSDPPFPGPDLPVPHYHPKIVRPPVTPPSVQNPITSVRTQITIDSTCPRYGADSIKFLATTKYDGKDVTFQRIGNIDSVGPVSFTKNDVYVNGEAKVYHSACRNYKDGTTCSYYYVVTLTADITAAPQENSISIHSYPPLFPNMAKRPVVFQSCKPRVRGDRKPCPQISGTICPVNGVTVWT